MNGLKMRRPSLGARRGDRRSFVALGGTAGAVATAAVLLAKRRAV
jgi:hypothetical protein